MEKMLNGNDDAAVDGWSYALARGCNDSGRQRFGVTLIFEEMRKSHLRWYRHIPRAKVYHNYRTNLNHGIDYNHRTNLNHEIDYNYRKKLNDGVDYNCGNSLDYSVNYSNRTNHNHGTNLNNGTNNLDCTLIIYDSCHVVCNKNNYASYNNNNAKTIVDESDHDNKDNYTKGYDNNHT
ncbi:unnamed protein product [Heligmosomoides polygyrus]|uniref:Metalloendopeptidase n=1 Tax=Heligmosomoides polygyrus TaxID=6339 RepID=A0A183FZI4_HELPZ|nr:unnamed protein product [Heligmosomoides polygyrus]